MREQKYSHAFCVAFTIINDIEDGHFTPYRDKLTAMAKRLTVLLEQEEPEAFDCYDSFEVNE